MRALILLIALTSCASSSKDYPYRVLEVSLMGLSESDDKSLLFCMEPGKCIVLEREVFERLRTDEINCRHKLIELEKK